VSSGHGVTPGRWSKGKIIGVRDFPCQRWSTSSCDTPYILIPTPVCRNGPSKNFVVDACLPTHCLRSDFLGVPGGGVLFVVHFSVTVTVTVSPSICHTQRNGMQSLVSGYPLVVSSGSLDWRGDSTLEQSSGSGLRKPQVVRSIRIAGSILSGAYKSLISSNLHAFNVSQCPWDVG
jgi:hypothetical protein